MECRSVIFTSLLVVALATSACSAAPDEEEHGQTSLAVNGVYAGTRITATAIANHARNAGLPCSTIVLATAVALGESEGFTRATHLNDDVHRSVDRGIWQINSYYWSSYSETCVFDAACNATAMAAISSSGSNWQPWLAYTNGRYLQFLDQARAGYAASGCNGGGGGTGGESGALPGTVSGTEGAGLRVRAQPSTTSAAIGSLADGTSVSIRCQVRGELVEGTDVWNYITSAGGYVSDAFVRTGYDGFHPNAQRCR